MDADREKRMEKRSVGRPMKVYIKGKEPIQKPITMAKEEWDFTPGATNKEKSESLRFAARLLYGDGKMRLLMINEQIEQLNFEKQLDDLKFQRRLEVLMEERARVNTISDTFARVRRDYPAFAFWKMMEESFRESRPPDPKLYTIRWGITCDIDKVLQDREDMRFQFFNKETAGWESKYNVKKGPHGKRVDEIVLEMINKEPENNPKEAK